MDSVTANPSAPVAPVIPNLTIEVVPEHNYGTLRRLLKGGNRSSMYNRDGDLRQLSASMMQLAGEGSVKTFQESIQIAQPVKSAHSYETQQGSPDSSFGSASTLGRRLGNRMSGIFGTTSRNAPTATQQQYQSSSTSSNEFRRRSITYDHTLTEHYLQSLKKSSLISHDSDQSISATPSSFDGESVHSSPRSPVQRTKISHHYSASQASMDSTSLYSKAASTVIGWLTVVEYGPIYMVLTDDILYGYINETEVPAARKITWYLQDAKISSVNSNSSVANNLTFDLEIAFQKWNIKCATEEQMIQLLHLISGANLRHRGSIGGAGEFDEVATRSSGTPASTNSLTAATVLKTETQSLLSLLRILADYKESEGGVKADKREIAPRVSQYLEYTNPMEEDATWTYQDGKKALMSATADKLVQLLSPETFSPAGAQYTDTFLLTYRSVLTSADLLKKLCQRYLYASEFTSTYTWRNLIRLRILAFTATWMQRMSHIFVNDAQLRESLTAFLEPIAASADPEPQQVAGLLCIILSKLNTKRPDGVSSQPQVPRNAQPRLSFLEINPKDLARRLTLHEHQRYASLRPVDFLTQLLGQGESAVLKDIIGWFNKVSFWAATEILTQPNAKIRSRIMEAMIEMAKEFSKLSNYNSLLALVSGMNNSSITRLKSSWDGVSSKHISALRTLEAEVSMGNNFASYRQTMENLIKQSKTHTYIPILSLFMKDLLFLADGNPKVLPNGQINFERLQTITTKIRQILTCQIFRYDIVTRHTEAKDCDEFLMAIVPGKEGALYKLSLLNEERTSPVNTSGSSMSPVRPERLIEKWEREAREAAAKNKK